MGRGTLHSPNQPSNHCTVRAQRRFERHGIKVEIMLVRSGDAKEAARGDVFIMKQTLLGARLPKESGSTQARARTSAPEVLKGAGSNGVRAGSSGALAEVRLRPASPAWAVTIRGASPTPADNLPVPTQTKVKPPEACAATNDNNEAPGGGRALRPSRWNVFETYPGSRERFLCLRVIWLEAS